MQRVALDIDARAVAIDRRTCGAVGDALAVGAFFTRLAGCTASTAMVRVNGEIDASAVAIGGGLCRARDHALAVKAAFAAFANKAAASAMVGVGFEIDTRPVAIGRRAIGTTQHTSAVGAVLTWSATAVACPTMCGVGLQIDARFVAVGGRALGTRDHAIASRTTITIGADPTTKAAMLGVIGNVIAALAANDGCVWRATDFAASVFASVAFGADTTASTAMVVVILQIDARTRTRCRRTIGTIEDTQTFFAFFSRQAATPTIAAVLGIKQDIGTKTTTFFARRKTGRRFATCGDLAFGVVGIAEARLAHKAFWTKGRTAVFFVGASVAIVVFAVADFGGCAPIVAGSVSTAALTDLGSELTDAKRLSRFRIKSVFGAVVTGLCEGIVPCVVLVFVDLAVTIVVFVIADLRNTQATTAKQSLSLGVREVFAKFCGQAQRFVAKGVPSFDLERPIGIFGEEAQKPQTSLRAFFGEALEGGRLHQFAGSVVKIGERKVLANKKQRKGDIFGFVGVFGQAQDRLVAILDRIEMGHRAVCFDQKPRIMLAIVVGFTIAPRGHKASKLHPVLEDRAVRFGRLDTKQRIFVFTRKSLMPDRWITRSLRKDQLLARKSFATQQYQASDQKGQTRCPSP